MTVLDDQEKVEIECARFLRNIGFKEPVSHYYTVERLAGRDNNRDPFIRKLSLDTYLDCNYHYDIPQVCFYSAPTVNQAVDWIQTNYGLEVGFSSKEIMKGIYKIIKNGGLPLHIQG